MVIILKMKETMKNAESMCGTGARVLFKNNNNTFLLFKTTES